MSDIRHIVIAQVWSIDLSRQICSGFLDYMKRNRLPWRISYESEQILDEVLKWEGIDGIILNSAKNEMALSSRHSGCPVVSMSRLESPSDIMQVDMDHFKTGQMAARHLIEECGCDGLAYVSYNDSLSARERRDGFRNFSRMSGADCEEFMLQHNNAPLLYDFNKVADKVCEWLAETSLPVGIFCHGDRLASALADHITAAGYRIPEDVLLLGCENDRMICEGAIPELSSVILPYRTAGFRAAAMLDHAMRGKPVQDKVCILEPEAIMSRGSTGGYGGLDKNIQTACEYIRLQACNGITVKDVARKTGLSQRSLERKFKQETGMTPNAYIQSRKINRAKELLRNTSMAMDEISQETGYSSGHSLGIIFKRACHQSAQAYRRQFRI